MSLSVSELTKEIWDNYQIAVIIIAALGPVIIIFLAIRFNRMKKRLIKQLQSDQRLIEKRIETYDVIGPKLNDMLSFFSYTGNWKELTPVDILRLKREVDRDINIKTALFSDELTTKYSSFMTLCFVSHSGWEDEEKIKSLYELRQLNSLEWSKEWIPLFDTNNVVEAITLKERYDELMVCFKKEMIQHTPA
jgi:hypothetical protein